MEHVTPHVSRQSLESGGERVFVTHPRMFSFSHRSLLSLRHPHLPSCVQQVDTDQKRPKKQWQSRGDRLADLLTDTSSRGSEVERWHQVSRMLDSMLFQDEIATRRRFALENSSLRRALESWWCAAGGTPVKGIDESTYKLFQTKMYNAIIEVSDNSVQPIISKAVANDWLWDSQGSKEVLFGRWNISILEVADNWVPTCDGEKYGEFLLELLQSVAPSPIQPCCTQEVDWSEKESRIQQTAKEYSDPPLILLKSNAVGNVEYVRSSMI